MHLGVRGSRRSNICQYKVFLLLKSAERFMNVVMFIIMMWVYSMGVMAEWLRRQIRNLVGSALVGSNPTDVDLSL